MADLRIDPAGVHAGAGMVRGATGASPPGSAVVPCAGDCASVDGANWLASQIAALDDAIASAELEAETVSRRLHASARAYRQQEWFSALALGHGGSGGAPSVGMPDVMPAVLPTPSMPPLRGVGVEPTSGRHAAALIHGGPGAHGLDVVEAALGARSQQLDQVAASLRAARNLVAHSWESTAAQEALAQMDNLGSRYGQLASGARQLAGKARILAENFRSTRNQMPTEQQFEELAARLKSAEAVNLASHGKAAEAVRHYTQQYAALDGKGRTTFAGYRSANSAVLPGVMPSPEAGSDPVGTTGLGGAGNVQPDGASSIDPSDARQGVAPADPQQLGGPAMQEMLGAVVPAVGAAMSGGLGGLMGAGAGAATPLAGLGQVASGLAGAAGAHAGASHAEPPGGLGNPVSGSPDIGKGLGGGGGGAGGTEPASAPAGPLVAPASATGVSAAAPVTTSAAPPSPASTAGMGGAPMGGGMMAPMMGGPMGGSGGSGSEADRELYAERRLRIETPPNSEPIKGRRETRRSRDDRPRG